MTEAFYAWDGKDLVLRVHVQSKASRDEIVGLHGDVLKVRITAAPVEGKANEYLESFLGKELGVPKSRVKVEKGVKRKEKTVRATGMNPEVLQAARQRWNC